MDACEYRVRLEATARRMSWFPTLDLRWIERIGNGPGYREKVLQQRWEQRWGQDIGGEEWRDIPIVGQLPESEGPISASITSTETAESPARQSGSPEVDPSGERQFDSFGLPIVKNYPPMPPVKPPRKDDQR